MIVQLAGLRYGPFDLVILLISEIGLDSAKRSAQFSGGH